MTTDQDIAASLRRMAASLQRLELSNERLMMERDQARSSALYYEEQYHMMANQCARFEVPVKVAKKNGRNK